MKEHCAEFLEGLSDLAEGREDAKVAAHVQGCPDCSRRLEQLRQIISSARLTTYDAPEAAIRRAKDLMVPQRRTFLAGLLNSTLATSGARIVAEDFQVVIEAEDATARLMYSRGPNGWDVLGRAPAGFHSVRRDDSDWPIEGSGRFSFRVSTLEETGFTLVSDDAEIVIPPAEELLGHEPRSDN